MTGISHDMRRSDVYVSVSSLPCDSDMQMVGRAQQVACESMANDMMATAWASEDASVANLRVPSM